MIGVPFDMIAAADLHQLVTSGASEDRTLEFKRELPGGSDAEIKEFLADVTSLANAHGGDLVFGVEESAGTAARIAGLAAIDIDVAILRLENLIRDGVEPRLSGARLRWIDLGNGTGVLAIRLPASLAAPHRIRFKNSGRFYSRNSRGKYEMDTHELRLAFTASEQLPVRLRGLHEAATAGARGENMPFRMNANPHVVISVMPLGFFRELRDLAITPELALAPVEPGGAMISLLTLEGALIHTPIGDQSSVRSYALTHGSGRIDAAWTIGGERHIGQGEPHRLVWPAKFESGVIDMACSAATKLGTFGVEAPWVVFISVAGIARYKLMLGNHETSEPAWRTAAKLPDLVLDRISAETLVPVFRSFWRLFGQERPANWSASTT